MVKNAILFLEKDIFDEGNPQKMCDIAKSLGYEVYWFPYVPFSGVIINQGFPLLKTPAIFYGSLNAIQYVNHDKAWKPGTWFDEKALRCSTYYVKWFKYLLNNECIFLPLHLVPKRKDWIFKEFGDTTENPQVFIRPDGNTKSFHGELVCIDKFDKWFELANFYNPDPSEMVVIARPKKIKYEWRIVINRGVAITCSRYRLNGEHNILQEFPIALKEYAEDVVGDYHPFPLFCLDIAETDEGYSVVECGSINAAGLYACDLEIVVKAMMEEICAKEII